jgi:hypothetical protein
MMEGWRTLCSEKLHNLCFLSHIISTVKSRMILSGRIGKGEMRTKCLMESL